jgi:hypothetical protein
VDARGYGLGYIIAGGKVIGLGWWEIGSLGMLVS